LFNDKSFIQKLVLEPKSRVQFPVEQLLGKLSHNRRVCS